MKTLFLTLFANLALTTTTDSMNKCAWITYQENIPEEFYKSLKKKR